MTKMFSNLSTEGLEETQDTLGGFTPLSSDVYDAKIKMAYVIESANSASKAIVLIAEINKQELRETIWFLTGKGDNFYMKDGKKVPMQGFVTIDDLCLFATEEGLSEQDIEEKTVKIWNSKEQKELPTDVPVLINLIDKPVKLGVLEEITFKQKKGDDGKYHDTADTRSANIIDKVFHPETGRTINEYKHEIDSPVFMDSWIERHQGKPRDKTKGKSPAGGGAGSSGSGRPGGGSGDGSPRKKLFG